MDEEEAKIYHKMIEIKNKLSYYRYHGATCTFNAATGESAFIPRKLSKSEKKDFYNLELEMKKLENKLRELKIQEDF